MRTQGIATYETMGYVLYLISMSIGFRSNPVAEKYNKSLLVPSSQKAPCCYTWIWQGALCEEGTSKPLLYFSAPWFELGPIDIDIKYKI